MFARSRRCVSEAANTASGRRNGFHRNRFSVLLPSSTYTTPKPGTSVNPNRVPAPGGLPVSSSTIAESCTPLREVSTRNPSLPLTVRIFPFTARVIASGSFKAPPLETVELVPAVDIRLRGSLIAAMRLFRLSATKSVLLFLLSARPVGPITSAAGSVRSENPEPMTVIDWTEDNSHRSTTIHFIASGDHRAVEHIVDKQNRMTRFSHPAGLVKHRHIPGAIDLSISNRFGHISVAVENQQAPSLGSCRSPVGSRQTANDDPAAS